jgi:hypothetical protein
MFLIRRALFAFILSAPILLLAAQQSTSTSPQTAPISAIALLQQAFAALGHGTPITDVTLSGTAHYIAGSDDETGTASLKALATGASRVDLNLSSGPRSEIMNVSSAPAGTWSGPDGVSHPIAGHNLMRDPAWFFPVFPIARGMGTEYTANYIGAENREGQAVQHIAIAQLSSVQAPLGAPSIAHLTKMDFFLDAITFLPAAVTFNIHPDNNALLDIPIEIRFTDYRAVNGAQVPFHIEKFLNNGLVLDLQFQSAALNSGLTVTEFAAQ